MPKPRREVEQGASFVELAAGQDPPVDLAPFIKRLRKAGATRVYVASVMDTGVFFEASSADEARGGSSAIVADARRFTFSEMIGWEGSPPVFAEALGRLVANFEQFDTLSRFRLAASHMRLTAQTAEALIEAQENDGPARVHDRIMETGMIITYVRPFLASNEAGIGERWWPKGESRTFHDEMVDLRHEYHAHAAHTPQRRLENVTSLFGDVGRPMFSEQWSYLPTWKLQKLEELATQQAKRFEAEAERVDVKLFCPKERQ